MDKAALRELAEDLAMNHEYCPKDVILKASDALLNLLAEIQSLTEERTAWRTTEENAEAELKAIKEAGPVAEIEVSAHPSGGVTAAVWSVNLPLGTHKLYTLEGKS